MRPVLSLLVGTALVLVANGLLTTVLGTRLAADGDALGRAGVVVSAVSVGLALGSWRGQWIVHRVGHIRAFAAFSGVATASALAIALSQQPWLWVVFRITQGFAVGGTFLVIESWLSERGGASGRARMLAMYVATCQIALATGQLLVIAQPPEGAAPFAFAAMLYSLALIPIALTRTPQPTLPQATPRARLVDVARTAPVAVGGCFIAGCTTGALLNLGPSYGVASGFTTSEVAVFMTSAVLGGLVLQIPIGRLSERLDRRVVIELIAAGTALSAAILAATQGATASTAAVFALGAFAYVLYPVSIAHAHDLVPSEDSVPASGTLVLAYGIGASVAPLLGSLGLEIFGAIALPATLLLANLALAGLAVARLLRRRVLPVEEPVPFTPIALPQVIAAPEPEEQQG